MRLGRLLAAVLISAVGGVFVLVLFLGRGGSVDETAYVAHNEAVFRSVSQYPGAVLATGYSIGVPKGGWLGNENGPPYKAFATWHVYRLSPPVAANRIIRYFRSLEGWTTVMTVGHPPSEVSLRKGSALIYVMATAGGYQMSADYGFYGGG